MKTTYGKILVLVMATIMLLATPLPCRAVEKEKIWSEDEPRRLHKRFELTEERIERIMNRLKETNAEKAEELSQLREKEPEKFKAELRKVTREQFGKRLRERGKERSERHMRRPRGGGTPGYPGMRGMGMHRRHGELLEWLEKHHPEEAERLRDLREDKPELFRKRMGLGLKRYAKIMEAEKENPELAAVLKEDLELKQQRDKLLRRVRKATDEQEKEKLVGELNEVVGARFDLIVKRKEREYEELRKRLARLRQQVQKSQANVEKWKDADYKAENVKTRVAELVGGSEKFRWE